MLTYAIIGFGKMGHRYDPLVKAKYIVDRFPVKNRICFLSTEEFIAYNPQVDLVIVSAPSHVHYHISKLLLNSGYHVLVEKPICLSSDQAKELEEIAKSNGLVLYQSTLERYNPVVKYLRSTLSADQIQQVVSSRSGRKPNREYLEDVKFDLGIHDVDLWMYLFRRKVPWEVHVNYGKSRRDIRIHHKDSTLIDCDLLNKRIRKNGKVVRLPLSDKYEPILEMLDDLKKYGSEMNEAWSKEIAILEEADGNKIELF